MAERPYMDRLDDFDDSTVQGMISCIKVINDGLNAYNARIMGVVNSVPRVDLPLLVVALRFAYEGCKNADPMLREAVEEIEKLPIESITTVTHRKGGGENG